MEIFDLALLLYGLLDQRLGLFQSLLPPDISEAQPCGIKIYGIIRTLVQFLPVKGQNIRDLSLGCRAFDVSAVRLHYGIVFTDQGDKDVARCRNFTQAEQEFPGSNRFPHVSGAGKII